MKKSIYILPLCALMLSACEMKEDYTELGSVDKRVTAKISEYQKTLCEAPYGWLADVQTGTGGTHRLWMGFDENEEVTMYTDYVEYYRALKTTPYTSMYSIKQQQMPTLSFDTYSYLSIFADPTPLMNGSGSVGVGMVADFEYEILSYGKGQFELRGLKHGMKAVLTEATAEEFQKVSEGVLMDCVSMAPIFEQQYYTFSYGGKSYELVSNGRQTALMWIEGAAPAALISGSQNDFSGNIILAEPMQIGDAQITRFDKSAKGYSVVIGNELIDIVRSSTTPASYMGLTPQDLTTSFIMPTDAQTEWNSEFYAIIQNMMTKLYNDQTMPVYMAYVGVHLFTDPVVWVEIAFYNVSSTGIDTSNVYATTYQYDLKPNTDGSYTFGDSYKNAFAGDTDVVSNLIKGHSTALLDGYFKGRTFYFKAWPKIFNGRYPYMTLMPTEGIEKTGAAVGYAYIQS